jgi:hypothetical protein
MSSISPLSSSTDSSTLVGKVPQADFAKLQRDDFAQLCIALEDEVPVL